jgi:ribosomal protein L12E/L44/L45/RPP1/RPP2
MERLEQQLASRLQLQETISEGDEGAEAEAAGTAASLAASQAAAAAQLLAADGRPSAEEAPAQEEEEEEEEELSPLQQLLALCDQEVRPGRCRRSC